MTRRLSSALLALFVLGPAVARADVVDDCANAAEKAEKETKAGHLSAARAAIKTCLDDACPAILRRDCADLETRVDGAQSSVVVKVTLDGADCKGTVLIDGKPEQGAASGLEVSLDPAPHTIEATCRDGAARTEIVLLAGEKLRRIDLALNHTAPSPPPPPPPVPAPHGPSRVAPIVFGSLALGSLVAGAVVGGVALGRLGALGCSPRCSPDETQPARTLGYVADTLFGVSVAFAITSVVLWVTAKSPTTGSARLLVGPSALGVAIPF